MSKWYGSIENRLDEGKTFGEIKVGTGVTEMGYSDRHPYEVVEVIDERHLMIRPLNWKVIKGSEQDGSAEYEYFSKPEAPLTRLFKAKYGWRSQYKNEDGNWKLGCDKFTVGFAERYRDPCF